MKEIIISHKTALLALRHYRTQENFEKFLDGINNRNFNIDILIKSANEYHKNKNATYHLQPAHYNEQMKITLNNNITCVCPELLICQMSRFLDFIDLALLVHEFCGTYSIMPGTHSFINDLTPITSITKILNFLDSYTINNHYFKNITVLNNVLKFAKDNSASPMESRICIKLCGPRRYGFYACDGLKLNDKISLSKDASLIAGQNIIMPDFSNTNKKVVIEYDSAQFHENFLQGQRDKRRRDALVCDGWKVFTIVPAVANDPIAFNVVACQILKALGQKNVLTSEKYKLRRLEAFMKLK